MATATTTAPKSVKATPKRRQPLPGEVNITNNEVARDALETLRDLKRAERAGEKAKRTRKGNAKNPGVEAVIRELLVTPESVLVVAGQPVAKLSSERHIDVADMTLLAESFPEAYAACVSRVTYRNVEVTGV